MITAIKNAFENLFKEPYTHAYPAAPIPKPKNYRGLIEYNAEFCIFCDKCEKVCPPKAIIFHQNDDGSKVYAYNPHLCIYCGDCVSNCPKPNEALWQSENKSIPALKADNVNEIWTTYELEAANSRVVYKEKKQAQKK